MSEILATFDYVIPPKFFSPRSYWKGFAIEWQPGYSILRTGNPFLFEEHVYGGYQVYLSFKPNVWNWNSNTYSVDYMIEDLYALTPITRDHVSVGTCVVGMGFDSFHPNNYLSLNFGGGSGFRLFDFPAGPAGYWLPPLV